MVARDRGGRDVTWQDVARADIEAGVRSRRLWAVVALFAVLMVAFGRFASREALPVGALLETNARTFAFLLTFLFVPIVGLLVGHRALGRARERNSGGQGTGDHDEGGTEETTSEAETTTGETEYTTGGTETTHDLFVGTVVGRTAVLAAAIFAGFLPAFVVWVVQSGVASLYEMLVAFLVAVSVGLLFVAVGIAISTLTTSTPRATAGATGAFVALYAWPFLPELVGIEVPYALLDQFWLVFVVGDLSTTLFSLRQGEVTSAMLGVVVLAALVATPLVLGYVRFSRKGIPGS